MRIQRRPRRPGVLPRAHRAFCAAVLIALAPMHAIAEADLFDELYRQGQKQNGDLRTLTASFIETTTSPLLTRPLIARGTLAVERPSRIAMRYTEPEPRLVLIDGSRMTMAWPARQIRDVRDVGAALRRIEKYFVGSSPDELRRHFTIAARPADDRPAYLVTMTPKRKQIQEGVSRLELWVDRESLLLSAMRLTFATGDTKLMTFSEVIPNAAIDPGVFVERKRPN
jgi:outer membrane lipoprotein-sorting protein